MDSTTSETVSVRRTDWRLVGVFYGVCFTWVSLMALVLYLAGTNLDAPSAQLAFLVIVALFYMPAPLVSALIAERVARRRPLILTTFQGFGRKLPRVLLTFLGLSVATYVTYLVLAFVFGNLLHVPGVGTLATSDAELRRAISSLIPPMAAGKGATGAPPSLNLPPIGLLYPLAIFSGLIAGLTINGLFAFGEEYGWRGFLMDELRPLGGVRANLVTGVLWGLWHAPIILLGYDFAPHRFLGIPAMVVLCTAFSFMLWRSRQFADSLIEPALLHGAFNGYGGFFLLLLVGRDPVVSVPVGLLGSAAVGLVALVFWKWSAGRLAEKQVAP